MFHQFDANAILQIPLSRQVVQDVIVWSFAKRGRYTVRSGYFVAKQLRKDELSNEESSKQGIMGYPLVSAMESNHPKQDQNFFMEGVS